MKGIEQVFGRGLPWTSQFVISWTDRLIGIAKFSRNTIKFASIFGPFSRLRTFEVAAALYKYWGFSKLMFLVALFAYSSLITARSMRPRNIVETAFNDLWKLASQIGRF